MTDQNAIVAAEPQAETKVDPWYKHKSPAFSGLGVGADPFLAMIERAARDPAIDIEKFERLMAMRERMDSRIAKQAFEAAVAEAKGAIGPIVKDKAVGYESNRGGGKVGYRYESLAKIASVIDPVLQANGLSYRYRATQADKKLTVTCILSHRDGHAEETTLAAFEDQSGAKNAVQAIGSAATYLQRYTLKLILGLSAADHDDDGNASGGNGNDAPRDMPVRIDADQMAHIEQLIRDTDSNRGLFLLTMKVDTVEDMTVEKYKEAVTIFARKKRAMAGQKPDTKEATK